MKELVSAQAQQKLLDKNLGLSGDHLTIVRTQVAEEKRRLGLKPAFQLELGEFSENQLLKPIPVAPTGGVVEMMLGVKNVGEVSATQVSATALASPATVKVSAPGRAINRHAPNKAQWVYDKDVAPFGLNKTTYTYDFIVELPPEVKDFSVQFRVVATNAAAREITVHFVVVK